MSLDGMEVLVVRPVAAWKESLRENEGLVARLRAFGATVLPDGALAIKASDLFRVSLTLREHGLSWYFEPNSAIETALVEGDPVTLINRILFDPQHPYSWLPLRPIEWFPEAEEIEDAIEKEQDDTTDFTTAKAVKVAMKDMDHGWHDPKLGVDDMGVGETVTEGSNEAGTESTDKKFNPCPAYLDGFCRVDGRACLYSIDTYQDCPKYTNALKMPNTQLAIPKGTEDDPYFGRGKFGDA